MMEIKKVYVKTRLEFGKQCIFDTCGPNMDEEIKPNPDQMNDYIVRTHCHVGVQHSRQLALHEIQSIGTVTKNSGMFHFEGGWPKEINPRDEETTARFRRRVEKDDDWAPKLRNLFQMMEHNVLQNGAVNIYEHYFDDMIPTKLVQPFGLRNVNIFVDPEKVKRPVSDISWSPDSSRKIVVSYCFLEFGRLADYSNTAYIWQVDNPNTPYMALEAFCPCVVSEFNPRDPSILASGLMSGQVCSWDLRTGTTPVQLSHRQFSHRDYTNAVKWLPTKSNTEFFSTSTDGYAMWWDTRKLREPTEVLIFDLETPNEPNIDRAIGVSCSNFGPVVGTKFMFGMENGIVISGSRKSKSNVEKLALRFAAHHGPVISVDRNVFIPSVFLTVGDWTARVWAEDTKEGNLVSTRFLSEYPTGGCWNKSKYSVFYIITSRGLLMAWDLLQGLQDPVLTIQLCKERLTAIAPNEEGTLLAIGNSDGKVYLVESTESLQSFDKKERTILSEYLERSSKFVKAVDSRLKEIKLAQALAKQEEEEEKIVSKDMKQRRRSKSRRRSSTIESEKEDKQRRKSLKGNKERSKKSTPKDKKKIKEEFPELIEAEERYFDIIEKEKEKYDFEEETTAKGSRLHSSVTKKYETRKSEKEVEVKPEKIKKPIDKEVQREIKQKTPKSKLKILKQESIGEKPATEELTYALQPTIKEKHPIRAERKEFIATTKKVERKEKAVRSIRKSRHSIGISMKRSRPCEREICKPRVCCLKPNFRNKLKYRRERESGIKTDEKSKVRYEEDERKRSRGIDSTLRQREMQRKNEDIENVKEKWKKRDVDGKKESTVSPSTLMDNRSREEGRIRPTRGRKAQILREMMAPPTELTGEVKRAKTEIQKIRILTNKVGGKYIGHRIQENRYKTKGELRKALIWKSRSDRKDTVRGKKTMKIDRKVKIDTEDLEKTKKKIDPVTTYDPCSPREGKSLPKEFETFLGRLVSKPMVDKEKEGKAYLEEIEAARSRVYPRISEFHSIE